MTAFVPIREASRLPVPGAPNSVEGHTLDFKEWHHGIAPLDLEVAKDVAAFANASGGVLIYGATAQGARLDVYEGKTGAEAECWSTRVDEIVRHRCAPPPIIEPRVFEAPDGASSIVVVNVNASAGQAIGVRVSAKWSEWLDAATGKMGGELKCRDAFLYPMRAGEGTRWLTPEQAAMLMIPRLRHAIALLRQITPNEVVFLDALGTDGVWKRGEYCLEGVEELENALLARPVSGQRDLERWPLDAVCTVWRGFIGREYRWRVYIDVTATTRR